MHHLYHPFFTTTSMARTPKEAAIAKAPPLVVVAASYQNKQPMLLHGCSSSSRLWQPRDSSYCKCSNYGYRDQQLLYLAVVTATTTGATIVAYCNTTMVLHLVCFISISFNFFNKIFMPWITMYEAQKKPSSSRNTQVQKSRSSYILHLFWVSFRHLNNSLVTILFTLKFQLHLKEEEMYFYKSHVHYTFIIEYNMKWYFRNY